MIEPLPCFSIAGIWCLAARKALVRLTLRVPFQPSSEMPVVGPCSASMPAFVEADIKAAIALLGTLDQLFGEGLVAHVAGKREVVSSLTGDLSHKRIQLRFAPSGDDYFGARASKQLRGRPPDAGARTRYDGHLVLEINHAKNWALGFLPGIVGASPKIPPVL